MATLTRTRALNARALNAAIEGGARWAWQLEAELAAIYERAIGDAYSTAARRLASMAHSPAGGLVAALTPAEREAKNAAQRARSAASARRTTARGHAGWTIPDPDELGLNLRGQMDAEHEQRLAGEDTAANVIRVEAMRRATKAGLELMGINFDARNPAVEGVLAQLGTKITEINATTRREIMTRLDESWKRGDSIPKAARALRDAGAEISKTRSVTIARTEILGAVNGGAHALASISDQLRGDGQPALLKIWLTAQDDRVRDDHIEAGETYGEGNGIALDEPFMIGSSPMQFPGDPDGAADEVINCRCALSYEEAETVATEATEATGEPAPAEPEPAAPVEPSRELRTSADVATLGDLRAFLEPPVAPLGEVLYSHAVRYGDTLDKALTEGLKPDRAGNVYLSAVDNVRDLGAGHVIVRVPEGAAVHSVDVVERGLKHDQWTVASIAPEQIMRVVREVPTGVGNQTINELDLARYALEHQGLADASVTNLPGQYQRWFDLPAAVERSPEDLMAELRATPAGDLAAQIAREQAMRPAEAAPGGAGTPLEQLAASKPDDDAALMQTLRGLTRARMGQGTNTLGAQGTVVMIDRAAEKWSGEQLTAMFQSRVLTSNGLRVKASSEQIGNQVAVHAFVETAPDAAGRGAAEVAELQRTIDLAAREVDHDSFFIEPAWQGKGIAKDLMRSSVAEYDAAGIERVNVLAAGKNGKYTWARFGFDFKGGPARARDDFLQALFIRAARADLLGYVTGKAKISARLAELYPTTYARIMKAEHAWEFAGLSFDDGGETIADFGKQALIGGRGWQGQLDLTLGSPGRSVFDAYTAQG